MLWQNNNGPGSIEDLILNGGTGNVGSGFNGGGINGTVTLNGTGPANPPGISGNLGAVLDVPYGSAGDTGETILAPIYLQTTSSFVVGQGTLAGTSCMFVIDGNIGGPGGLTKDWVSGIPAVRESQSTDWLNSQGTLALYGNNTYAGSTAIYSGTILLGSSGALPNTTVLTIDGSNGSTLDLGGNNVSVAGLYNGPNGGGTITSNGAGAVSTLTINGAGNFSGVIQDGTVRTALAIASSSGVFTLGGTNRNTGGVTVSQGTLQLASANAAPQSIVTVNSNSELTFNTGNGSITTFNVAGMAGSGNVVLADSSGAYFTLSVGGNNASSAFNGQLSGNGGLFKSGNGTLNLGGALSYTGSTTVSGGLLSVNVTDSASPVAVNAGATLGGSGSVISATVAGGGAIQAGSNGQGGLTIGTLTFNASSLNPAAIDVANITNYAATPAVDVTGANGLTVSGGSSVTIALSGPAPTGSGTIELLAVRRFDPGPQRLRGV